MFRYLTLQSYGLIFFLFRVVLFFVGFVVWAIYRKVLNRKLFERIYLRFLLV